MAITLDAVIAALRTLKDPRFNKDYMAMGMVRDLKITGQTVSLTLQLSQAQAALKKQIQEEISGVLKEKAGASAVSIEISIQSATKSADPHGVPGVQHIIAVSSGKGGVGKSTVATNLAIALHELGASVGLLDADIYGPNLPTMLGTKEPPHARMDEVRGELIIPNTTLGIKMMSMGLLSRGDTPTVWRGPMLHSVIHQFLLKVDWGSLDYLVVDMPPGTGDVQISLTQLVPVTGAVVVTTPQEVAMQDVRKAILMFEKVGVPILGIVENMSYFICGQCEKKHEIFGTGGGQILSEKFRTRLLSKIPLEESVREAGDSGVPALRAAPQSASAREFLRLAQSVVEEVQKVSASTGTSSGVPEIQISGFDS